MIIVTHRWVEGHIWSEATRGVDAIFTDWALEPQEAHTYAHLALPYETIYVYGASETPFSLGWETAHVRIFGMVP